MSIADILLEISIYSAIIFGVIILFKYIFNKKLSLKLHYAVWLLLIIRLMMPVTIQSGFSFFTIPADTNVVVGQTVQTAPTAQTVEQIPTTSNANNVTNEYPAAPQEEFGEVGETTSVATPKAKPFNSEQTILLIWVIGMVSCGIYYLISYIKMRRKLTKGIEPTEYLQKLFDECKREMGIRSEVKLSCHYGLNSPALMVNRVLMPLEIVVSYNDGQIKHMIMHELCHYKRKDYIALIVMAILRSVYFFNPVVWVASSMMRDDMERACDADVVSGFTNNEKSEYALTILHMFKRNIRPYFVLSMASGKKLAKSRIEGIFMKNKTKKSVCVLTVMFALLIGVTCFTTACQPMQKSIDVKEPDEDLQNVELQNEIRPTAQINLQTQEFVKLEAPTHVSQEPQESNSLIINLDADVVVPNSNGYPVTQVEKRTFTEDVFLQHIQMFAGDAQLYSEWVYTKEEILPRLTAVKEKAGTEETLEYRVDYLQSEYDNAPETYENKEFSLDNAAQTNSYDVFFKMEDGNISNLMVSDEYGVFYTRSVNNMYTEGSRGKTSSQNDPKESDLSEEDAYKKAEEYLEAFDADLELYSSELYTETYDAYLELYSSELYTDEKADSITGWAFTFTRETDGLQAQYGEANGFVVSPYDLPTAGSPWGEEMLKIAVDADGISYVWWRGASEIESTVEENAELLPFEEIQKIAIDQLLSLHGWPGNEIIENKSELKITDYELGISLLSEKDNPQTGQYVPTWYVSYEGEVTDDFTEYSQIMFDARDGSYVEPRMRTEELPVSPM